MNHRDVLADRLREAGLLEARFIPVQDGGKASVVAHSDPENRHSDFDNISGNYGVYAGGGLVDVDVDDYGDSADVAGLEAVNSLPGTLTVESPHTDGETGGHRYYHVTTERGIEDFDVESIIEPLPPKTAEAARGDPVALAIAEAFGVANPHPNWGELRVTNQYVVGPGSELDSCDKDWHDCSLPDEGQYRIAKDAPIAEIPVEQLIDVLEHSGVEKKDKAGKETFPDPDKGEAGDSAAKNYAGDGDFEEALEVARNDAKIVTYLTQGAGVDFDGDRSDADYYVACRMAENGISKGAAERVLVDGLGEGNTPPTKARSEQNRPSYWQNTWRNAVNQVGDGAKDTGLYDSEHALDSALEMLAGVLDSLGPDEEPSDQQAKSVRTIAAKLPESEYEAHREEIAEAIGTNLSRLDEHRDHYRHRERFGNIRVHDGGTFYLIDTDAGLFEQQVLNFELDVDSILRMQGREVIDARVKQSGGVSSQVQFEPRDLQKKQRFKDNVLAGKFGLTFESGSANDEPVLNALNEYIQHLDAPVRRGTHHIGLHSDGNEWVTPQGTLNADGWTDDPNTIYVDREVALERAFDLPTNTAEFDRDDVAEILRSLPKTRDPSRMLAVLGWFYAAPLRPYIFDKWNAGAFNHLNITGDTGSGKTTTLRYLWRAFGVQSDPFAVTDTKFAMLTALSASNGLPVWYDEYKPSEIQDYRLAQFHDLYRKSATGGTATRGKADQTTEEYHTHAPIVVSGEEQIRRPAERRRSIMVAFREDVTDKGTETRRQFKELVGEGRIENGEFMLPDDSPDPTNHALAYYRWIADVDGDQLKAKWDDAHELVWQLRQDWEGEFDLDDMEVQGMRTVAFGWMVMRAFGSDHGVDLADLPDESDLDAALRHIAGEIGPEGQRKSHMDRFIELLERAAAAGYVKRGQQYVFVREGKSTEELRIRLERTRDALSKYVRDHGLDSEELLSNAADYRKRFKEAAESGDSYVVTHSQNTPPLGRCVGISTIAAMNELDFDRRTLGAAKQNSAASGDSDDGEPSQEKLYETVMAVVRTYSNGEGQVDTEQVYDALGDKYDSSRLDHAIEKLKTEGAIYEPSMGTLAIA